MKNTYEKKILIKNYCMKKINIKFGILLWQSENNNRHEDVISGQ